MTSDACKVKQGRQQMSELSNARRFNSSSINASFITDPSSTSAVLGRTAAAGPRAAAEAALLTGVLMSIGRHQTSIVGTAASPLDTTATTMRCSCSSSTR